jgi:hypothetical protein
MARLLWRKIEAKTFAGVFCLSPAILCAAVGFGCNNHDSGKASLRAAPKSTVEVALKPDSVVISTKEAVFRLSPLGALSASLVSNGKSLDPAAMGVSVGTVPVWSFLWL